MARRSTKLHNIERTLKLAVRHHSAGKLKEASSLYHQCLRVDPDNATALELITKSLAINPNYADAHGNLGHVLQAMGRMDEALASFTTAVFLAPGEAQTHNNLGNILKEIGRLDDAIESYHMAVTLHPGFAEAHCNNGSALQELGHLIDAQTCYQTAIDLRPDYAAAHSNMGSVLRELGRIDEAIVSYKEALRLLPNDASTLANLSGLYISGHGDKAQAIEGSLSSLALLREQEFGGASRENTVAKFKSAGIPVFRLIHDLQQANYLAAKGYDVDGLTQFRENGESILLKYEQENADKEDKPATIKLSAEETEALLPYLQAAHFYRMPETLPHVLNPGIDWQAQQDQYLKSTNQIMHIDDFLSADALLHFQEFCLTSKVWTKEYQNKYLGAFSDQGFISTLHLQLAEELKEKMPVLFSGHPLGRFWGFKYDSILGKGINVHADFALINLNFWITPDQYNLAPDAGGLKVYDVPSPANWRFKAYNEGKQEIYKFIDNNNGGSVTIAHRCNRAVLFNSAYFHETDAIHFQEGYESRRINITYLFGSR